MATILIPANQTAKANEYITVMINDIEIHIKSTKDTRTASYDEVFQSSEFNRSIHGFTGINDILSALVIVLL